MQGTRGPPGHGVRERERAWERKKERQRDRESGVADLERDLSDGLPDDAVEPTPIFVCGAARTHVVHFPAGAAVGELRAAVKRMGYSAGENGLCVVGGAPLPLDDRLTLAQCGIRANSSVQVAGRLRGGVEVIIRRRQHTVNARGHLDLRNQNFGPAEVKEVAAFLATSAGGAINVLTLDSTGNMRDQKTYTLTAGEEKIDLSQKNLGSADVTLLAAWLQRPEVTAAVEAIAIGGNPITSAGGATLIETIKTSKLKTIDIGKPLPLKEPYESDTLDLSNAKMDPGHVMILSWWLATDAAAAVASLCCANNPGMVGELDDWGRLKKPDVQAEVFKQLTDSLKTSKVTEVDFSSCGIGPVALGHLSDLVRDATGAVDVVVLSGNMITGSRTATSFEDYKVLCGDSTISSWSSGRVFCDLDLSGLISLCEALPGLKKPIHLDLANCSLSVNGVNELGKAIAAGAAINLLTLSSTGNMRNQKTYTLTAGEGMIDLSQKNLGSADVTLLTSWLQRPEVTGAVARIVLNGNMISKKGKDLSGLTALCDITPTLENPISLELADCNLKVAEVNELARAMAAGGALTSVNCLHNPLGEGVHIIIKVFEETPRLRTLCGLEEGVEQIDWSKSRKGPADVALLAADLKAGRAIGALNSIVLDGNLLTGTQRQGYGYAETTCDVQIDGFKALCDALAPSQIREISLKSCWLGPQAVVLLADAINFMGAVNSVTVDGNPIGYPSGASVKPGAVTGVAVEEGVFAAVDGRFGEVTEDPDSDREVKLRWLDDGNESSYTKVDKLTSVVASRSDLIEDYSHIRSLGEALSGSKVHTYGLANCKFNPVSLATFVQSVRWETGAVAHLALSSNPIGDKAMIPLLDTLKDIPLISFDISNTDCGVSTASKLAELLTEETKFRGAVAHLALGSNPFGDEAMLDLLEALKDVPLISLDISRTSCRDPSANELTAMLAATQKEVDFVEERGAKRRMLDDGAIVSCSHVTGAIQACTPFRMCFETIDFRNCRFGRTVAKEIEQAASEVSRARLRTYQVLTFSEVLVDRLGQSSSMQILSEDLCIQVAREVFSTHNHEGLCAALARLGQTWFSARVFT
eukprot:COSAG03_NODE_719_length_6112_cov_89.744553_3_plen_1095_part_00